MLCFCSSCPKTVPIFTFAAPVRSPSVMCHVCACLFQEMKSHHHLTPYICWQIFVIIIYFKNKINLPSITNTYYTPSDHYRGREDFISHIKCRCLFWEIMKYRKKSCFQRGKFHFAPFNYILIFIVISHSISFSIHQNHFSDLYKKNILKQKKYNFNINSECLPMTTLPYTLHKQYNQLILSGDKMVHTNLISPK